MASVTRKRPSLWSYLSFQKTRPDRSSSISSQLRPDCDPHEKPNRHSDTNRPPIRWARIIAIIVLFCIVLFTYSRKTSVDGKPNKDVPSTLKPESQKIGQVASDPDAGTSRCRESYSPDKPIVQYAVMIDAGSTGTRIHVYKFNNCGSTPELESEFLKTNEVALSAFSGHSELVATGLNQLIEEAKKIIPKLKHKETPIALKATAGLRLIGPDESTDILNKCRTILEDSPFQVIQNDDISIMDGKDEGVYAWITLNYLLGRIGTPEFITTAAIIDLGGASTQIVFEPKPPTSGNGVPQRLIHGDHKYDLKFRGREAELYQHSYLGFGLMEARREIYKKIAKILQSELGDGWSEGKVINPCFAVGHSRDGYEMDHEEKHLKIDWVGPNTSNPAACRRIAEELLEKNKYCPVPPCSFDGVHQPSLAQTFNGDIYILSYFFDRINTLGMPTRFSLKELEHYTQIVCDGESAWKTSFLSIEGATQALIYNPEYCMDMCFILTLLQTGFELPLDQQFSIAKQVREKELGWCLGATLSLFDRMPVDIVTAKTAK